MIEIINYILFTYLGIMLIVFLYEYFASLKETDQYVSKGMQCFLVAVLWPLLFYFIMKELFAEFKVKIIIHKINTYIKNNKK